MKTKEDKVPVNIQATSMIIPMLISPLTIGGKKPKNKTVQEKPTGAFFITSYLGCLRFSVENAITNYLKIFKKILITILKIMQVIIGNAKVNLSEA